MRLRRRHDPTRYERSGGRRAWEWLRTQWLHSWYQAGPQTPNQMDLHGYFTPTGQDQARQEAFQQQYGRR